MSLRTLFGVNDDLQEFAESWLSLGCNFTQSKDVKYVDGAMVSQLYRDDKFQVELCCVPPGFVIPDHVHPHADTIELTVAGVLRLHVNGSAVYAGMTDDSIKRLVRGRGVRINHDDVHGTEEPVGENGAMFLSIQRWVGQPMSVLTDYAGQALGGAHLEILDANHR